MSRASPVQDPRIAKKEMIVTRLKSAQQKKTLTEPVLKKNLEHKTYAAKMAQSVSKSTNIGAKSSTPDVEKAGPKNKTLKKATPKKSPNKSKKMTSESKSPILIEDDNPEYYPDKQKRTPGSRKVFLKPKQKSTMIARTNKRKFNTPKRGIKSPSPMSPGPDPDDHGPVYSELSMAEVIRIVEETDSLDDEDLMEILTCPSPVWWEEPPDEMYIEEAICSRIPEENTTGKTKSPIRERCMNTLRNSIKIGNTIVTQATNVETSTSNKKTDVKKDDKFIKKSKKLENVLGNIKNKVSKDVDKIDSKNEENNEKNNSAMVTDEESSNKVNTTLDLDVAGTDENSKTDKDDVGVNVEHKDVEIETETVRKIKKLSESTEGSVDSNQELLLDLENIDIPVRDSIDLNSPDCVIINDDNSSKIIDIDNLDCKSEDENEDHEINKNDDNCNSNTKIKPDECVTNKEIKQESTDNDSVVNDEQNEVPKNMPPLTKRPKFENVVIPSPNSLRSISDDVTESSSMSGVDIMDTISDTNIKFITDDDIDDAPEDDDRSIKKEDLATVTDDDSKVESKVTDQTEMSEMNELAVLMHISETKSKDTYMTVYKIMPNDESAQSKPANKFKNIPEYSSYVKNLMQAETKTENTTDDSLENEIPDVPDNKGQLNSFYKKCKNGNRKRKRVDVQDKNDVDSEMCKSPKKSITVAQDENVKYCMKCSAIFDTEECSYCLKNQKDTDKIETSFTCDKCDFVGESKSNVHKHLEEHKKEVNT